MWSSTTSAMNPAIAPANAGNHVHDAFAFGLVIESPLDCFKLAFDPTDPCEQLFLFPDRVAH